MIVKNAECAFSFKGNEWPVLEELVKKSPEVLWATDQLNLEFHFEMEQMVYQANLIRSLLVEFDYHVWNWHVSRKTLARLCSVTDDRHKQVNPLNKPLQTVDMKPMALPLLLEISLMRVRK